MGYEKGRGADMDDACAWAERLGWAYGLIARDPAERGVALDQLVSARKATAEALDHFNRTLLAVQEQGARHPYEVPVLRSAHEEYLRVRNRSLPDGVWGGCDYEDLLAWPGLPYALLFLEWEARYPEEWTHHAKAWGTKEGLIRDLAAEPVGQDAVVRGKLIDLVELVVRRAYRCKDREYVRVARVVDGVDGQSLRVRLEAAQRSENPWARLHAGYVLWMLDRPEVPNSRLVWRTWLTDTRG